MSAVTASRVVAPLGLPRSRDPRAGIPSATARRSRVLPLAEVNTTGRARFGYAVATLDRGGRLSARAAVRALGWPAGQRLDIRIAHDLLVVSADDEASVRLSAGGQVRISARLRRWCGLHAGERVLLAADPRRQRLVIHLPAALDAVLSTWHARVVDGDLT